ncbi:MAG: hypothetical protein J6U23_13445 [Clostridiales bacterium]|nr:hypothetical protein [Clostridiales bacterium]
MIQKKIICDWCNKEAEGDYFTAFRNRQDGAVIGKSDYCESCWNKMHHYPDIIKARRDS